MIQREASPIEAGIGSLWTTEGELKTGGWADEKRRLGESWVAVAPEAPRSEDKIPCRRHRVSRSQPRAAEAPNSNEIIQSGLGKAPPVELVAYR